MQDAQVIDPALFSRIREIGAAAVVIAAKLPAILADKELSPKAIRSLADSIETCRVASLGLAGDTLSRNKQLTPLALKTAGLWRQLSRRTDAIDAQSD